MRGVGQAEQQPHLGDRVAEHAHHSDPPGPAHGVARRRGRGRCSSRRRGSIGREQDPREAKDGGADRVGVDHGEQHEPWQDRRRRARSPRPGVPTTRKPSTGSSSRIKPSQHQRHATQQDERRDVPPPRRLDVADARRAPAASSSTGGPPFGAWRTMAPGWGAATRGAAPIRLPGLSPPPAPGARPCPGGRRAPRGRSPSPSARSIAAARCAPHRHAATALSARRLSNPAAPVSAWAPTAVRGEGNGGGRAGWPEAGPATMVSRVLMSWSRFCGSCKHLERPARIVRCHLRGGTKAGREGQETGEDQQAQHDHGYGQQPTGSVNKVAMVRRWLPSPAVGMGKGLGSRSRYPTSRP